MPWSLDWLSQILKQDAIVVSSTNNINSGALSASQIQPVHDGNAQPISASKKNGAHKHSVGFLKRVARMPSKDRKEILKVLKRQSHKRKIREVTRASNEGAPSLSDSSNSSSSSLNKDWKNWVLLHGKPEVGVEDVWGIVKAIGVKYKGDKMNCFNLLSLVGRKDWKAVGGGVGGSEGVGGGC